LLTKVSGKIVLAWGRRNRPSDCASSGGLVKNFVRRKVSYHGGHGRRNVTQLEKIADVNNLIGASIMTENRPMYELLKL
jgi:hypothetical protein